MTDHWCTYCQGVNAHNCQFNPNLPRMEVYTTNTTAGQPKTRPLRAEQVYEICRRTLPKTAAGLSFVPEWALLRDARLDEADAEIAELRGQAVVLRRLLADALAVLRTIEPDDTDEAERLESLCAAVALAIQPKREGALL